MRDFDVIVAGAGPAGLSAAEILGRCRRRVLVCDTGRPRNAASHALHGYLTRDGSAPAEFLRIACEELRRYDTVELRAIEVTAARRESGGFTVDLADGSVLGCRKLLIATGVTDELPELEGLAALYGRSVFHCPYCDGWEVRDQPLAVYGSGRTGAGLALELTAWSRDLVLCTDGDALEPEHRDTLARLGVAVREEPIARLEGRDGILERIVFAGGATLARRALFFCTGQHQSSSLAADLGCVFNEKGTVHTGDYEITNVPGLFVAGDASRMAQMVVVAAAEGAQAALAMNRAMTEEDLARLS